MCLKDRLLKKSLIVTILIFLRNGKVCIEFADNSVYNSPIYNRRSFSGYRRVPEIQHISPISHESPSYGTARRKPLSLHTLSDTASQGLVERVRIDPRTNIVQATDKLFDIDPDMVIIIIIIIFIFF